MSKIIEIREFKGVFSNCDVEDLAPEFLTVCKNLIPKNGRLIKSFGFGNKIATAFPFTGIKNIFTYIHDELSGDKLYIGTRMWLNNLRVHAWSGADWKDIITTWSDITNFQSLTGDPFVRSDVWFPILQEGGVLRIMTSNVGEVGGVEAKGLWCGYIDRKVLDEFLTITAGFYGYPTTIKKPSLTVTQEEIADGAEESIFSVDDVYYYKFSYVYDGVQESLLSDREKWTVAGANKHLLLKFQITKASFNKRITAIKVYRSTDEEANYRHIHTIDLLRKNDVAQSSGSLIIGSKYRIENNSGGADFTNVGALYNTVGTEFTATGTTPTSWGTGSLIRMPSEFYGDIDGGKGGLKAVYVPALASHNFTFYDAYRIICDVGGTPGTVNIDVPTGTGNTLFQKSDAGNIGAGYTNQDWQLDGWTAGGGWVTDLESAASGCYAGVGYIFVTKDLSGDNIEDSHIVFDQSTSRKFFTIIHLYEKRAVQFYSGEETTPSTVNRPWRVFLTNKGLFAIEDGASVQFLFIDNGLVAGAEHPLAGEKSIKVNGKFAKIILERLWNFNIVLDPGGENEAHEDWASFSEIGQYDVTPVSNVERIIDREGGAGTGIAEIFGNPVFLKPQAIITFNAKYYPDEPEKWAIMESAHNVGNIADEGYIEVLDNLYIIYYDGIYRLRPNNLAETDSTPTERLKISEPIGDTYNALTLTQKKAIKSEYDEYKNEIIFTLGSAVYAFNIDTEKWREISTSVTVTIMTKDENANILVYNTTDSKIYSSGVKESVKFNLKLKTFVTSDERAEVVRYITITYKSASALTVNLFAENVAVAVATKTLALSATIITKTLAIRYRAKKFTFSIEDVAGTTDAEVDFIKIEHT